MYKIEQYEIIISYFEQKYFGNKMNMKYVIYKARSEKYKLSAVPQMQRMLNKDYQIQVRNFKQCIKRSKGT